MAEPDNQTLRLLRELRADIQKIDGKVDELGRDLRGVEENLTDRIKSLQQAMIGESVLGRYAVAEVDERLDAIEKRLAVLEKS